MDQGATAECARTFIIILPSSFLRLLADRWKKRPRVPVEERYGARDGNDITEESKIGQFGQLVGVPAVP